MIDPSKNKLKNYFTYVYQLEFFDKKSSVYKTYLLLSLSLVSKKVARLIRKHPAIAWEADWIYDSNDDSKSLYGSVEGNEYTITVSRLRLHYEEEELAV